MCFRVCCDSTGHLQGRSVVQDAALLTLTVFSDELVQAGWEKCWSKRENRPYYFNRFTNQSLWEMPVLGQHDVIVSAHSPRGSCARTGVFMVCAPQITGVGGSSVPSELPARSILWHDSGEVLLCQVHVR